MNYLDQQYNSTQYPIIVTENGISSKGNGTDEDPELNDHWRADFYHGYIGQLHRAVTEDKINVFGYTGNSNEPFHGDIFTHGLIKILTQQLQVGKGKVTDLLLIQLGQ